MAEKKKYPYNGQEVEGEPVEFTTPQGENWTLYDLSDGSKLKTRIVMLEVVRLDLFDDRGQPIYLFNAQQVVSVTPEPSLTKKAV